MNCSVKGVCAEMHQQHHLSPDQRVGVCKSLQDVCWQVEMCFEEDAMSVDIRDKTAVSSGTFSQRAKRCVRWNIILH